MQNKEKIEALITDMALPIAGKYSVEVEDVEYVKEGPGYYLRVFLDKEGGVTIDDCEKVSRELSDRLDENDPISTQYYLEVSSPGLDRQLSKPKHFEKYMGRKVDVKFYKPVNGNKKITGILKGYENGQIQVEAQDTEYRFSLDQAAYIKLFVEI